MRERSPAPAASAGQRAAAGGGLPRGAGASAESDGPDAQSPSRQPRCTGRSLCPVCRPPRPAPGRGKRRTEAVTEPWDRPASATAPLANLFWVREHPSGWDRMPAWTTSDDSGGTSTRGLCPPKPNPAGVSGIHCEFTEGRVGAHTGHPVCLGEACCRLLLFSLNERAFSTLSPVSTWDHKAGKVKTSRPRQGATPRVPGMWRLLESSGATGKAVLTLELPQSSPRSTNRFLIKKPTMGHLGLKASLG